MTSSLQEHDWHQLALAFWLQEMDTVQQYLAANSEEMEKIIASQHEAAAGIISRQIFDENDGLLRLRLNQFLSNEHVIAIGSEPEDSLFPALRRVLAMILMRYSTTTVFEVATGKELLEGLMALRR